MPCRNLQSLHTCASDSPYVLMLSVPHSTTAIVSGQALPLSSFCRSNSLHIQQPAHCQTATLLSYIFPCDFTSAQSTRKVAMGGCVKAGSSRQQGCAPYAICYVCSHQLQCCCHGVYRCACGVMRSARYSNTLDVAPGPTDTALQKTAAAHCSMTPVMQCVKNVMQCNNCDAV